MNAELRLPDLPSYRLAVSPGLVPFVKWPGGKTQELPAIASAVPR